MKNLKSLLLLAHDYAGDLEITENLLINYTESGNIEKAKGAQISRDYVKGKLDEVLNQIKNY